MSAEPYRRAAAPSAPARAIGTGGARLRARGALAEARAQMPSLLAEPASPDSVPAEHLPAEAAGLRRALRAYTDRVDGLLAAADEERRALREQVDKLSHELQSLRAELAEVKEEARGTRQAASVEVAAPESGRAGPAPHAPERMLPPASMDEPVSQAPGTVEPAAGPPPEASASLEQRVFPAGTVGLILRLKPVERHEHLAAIGHHFRAQPHVEQVQQQRYEAGRADLRLTFRQAVSWPSLRAVIEAAAGAPIDPASVTLASGVLSVTLGGEVEVAGSRQRAVASGPAEPLTK